MTNKNKDSNGSDGETPEIRIVSIDDLPKGFIAEMNNIVTQTEPDEFLPHFHNISRENAFLILELTHRGQLAPSYQCYGYLTCVVLTGSAEKALKSYSDAVDWIRSLPNNLPEEETK